MRTFLVLSSPYVRTVHPLTHSLIFSSLLSRSSTIPCPTFSLTLQCSHSLSLRRTTLGKRKRKRWAKDFLLRMPSMPEGTEKERGGWIDGGGGTVGQYCTGTRRNDQSHIVVHFWYTHTGSQPAGGGCPLPIVRLSGRMFSVLVAPKPLFALFSRCCCMLGRSWLGGGRWFEMERK